MRRIGCAVVVVVLVAAIGVAVLREMLLHAVEMNNDSATAVRILTVAPFLKNEVYDNGVLRIPLLVGAVTAKNKATTKALLSHGATVDTRNHCKQTALMLAAEWGDVEVIQMLLASGADANATDNIGKTPLHYAIDEQKNLAALALLRGGANPNAGDKDGDTPLAYAVDLGNKGLVNLLRMHGAKDPVSIFESAAFGDVAVVRRRLSTTPSLLEAKGMRGMTPLDYAADHGQADVVRFLLSRGARISTLAVSFAADSGSIPTVEQLLSRGGEINPKLGTGDYTPLYLAVAKGDSAMVRYLVEKGADLHNREDWGTPLEHAEEDGHKEIARYLRTVIQRGRK